VAQHGSRSVLPLRDAERSRQQPAGSGSSMNLLRRESYRSIHQNSEN
jgi:hypothetical protein